MADDRERERRRLATETKRRQRLFEERAREREMKEQDETKRALELRRAERDAHTSYLRKPLAPPVAPRAGHNILRKRSGHTNRHNHVNSRAESAPGKRKAAATVRRCRLKSD